MGKPLADLELPLLGYTETEYEVTLPSFHIHMLSDHFILTVHATVFRERSDKAMNHHSQVGIELCDMSTTPSHMLRTRHI